MSEGRDEVDLGLRSVMHDRRQQLNFRLLVTCIIVACYARGFNDTPVIAWGVAYTCLQALDLKLFWSKRPLFPELRGRAPMIALTLLALNSTVFGGFSLIEIVRLGGWGFVTSSYILAGSIVTTVLTTISSRRAFYASLAPFLLYLGAIPPLMAFGGAAASVVLGTATGGALLFLSAMMVWHRAARAQAQQTMTALALERALAQANAASEAKSAFLATMSHEIRTPLNGVLGMAQVMIAGELSPVQRERLGVVTQSGEALLAILNDVLDLSKIEAGQMELESIPFDLSEVVRGAHSTFTALANRKGLSFNLTISPAAEGVYVGDPTRLRQILYNLASNALKFTPAGRVDVLVDRQADELSFSVIDTGIGMTAEQVSKLFESFSQADASITRRFGGTGLGLVISRELVERMGGRLRVASQPDEGSTFSFSVPAERVVEPQHRRPGAPLTTTRPEGGGSALRVLAAEDNPINQLVLMTLLHQAGIEPTIVENGRLALDAWDRAEWDAILMDVHMPEMDGLSAAREIRAREGARGRARTPIIALTANAMQHQVAELADAGMDLHVAKPLEVGKLFAALDSVLDRPARAAAAQAA